MSTYSMRVNYFLFTEKFCVEKRIRICQALNFMEQNFSGSFWLMSGFKNGLLLLTSPMSGEKGKSFPIVLN